MDKVGEVDHSVTLANIVEIAIKKEAMLTSRTSLADMHDLRTTKVGTKKGFIKKKQHQGDSTTISQSFKDEPKCAHYGGTRHDFAKCKFKGYRGNKCQKVGHLARVCNMKSTNCVYPEEVDETELELSDMYMFGSDKVTEGPELVEMIVEGQPLQIEIDSGAGRSAIPERVYREKFSHCKLKDTKIRLKMYSGDIIIPQGQIEVEMCYKDRKNKCALIVVEHGCRPLLGRDLMKKFGSYIASMNTIEASNELQKVLDEFQVLFDGQLGK